MSDNVRVKDLKEPYMVESPHGWKDMVFWRYVNRRKFMFISGTIMIIFCYRQWRVIGGTPSHDTMREELPDKTVVIVGGTSGIGRYTAGQLAKQRARVILACKNLEKCRQVRREIIHDSGNEDVFCRKADLSNLQSVRNFAKKINETEEKIDCLVNCAAIALCPKTKSKIRKFTADGFELTMGVNHFGPFLLTNLLVDKLKMAKNGRIINVACESYMKGELNLADMNLDKAYHSRQAYYNSKLAQMVFSRELARRLHGSGITVITFGLGPVWPTGLEKEHLSERYFFTKFITAPYKFFISMSSGEAALNVLAAVIHVGAGSAHGRYLTIHGEKTPPPKASNDELGIKLWKLSEKWTKLEPDFLPSPLLHKHKEDTTTGALSKAKITTPKLHVSNPMAKPAPSIKDAVVH